MLDVKEQCVGLFSSKSTGYRVVRLEGIRYITDSQMDRMILSSGYYSLYYEGSSYIQILNRFGLRNKLEIAIRDRKNKHNHVHYVRELLYFTLMLIFWLLMGLCLYDFVSWLSHP